MSAWFCVASVSPKKESSRGQVGWWPPPGSRSPCATVLLTCSVIRACLTLSLGLSFPICTTEADASRALPSSAPLVSSCKWEREVFSPRFAGGPGLPPSAFRLPPSRSQGSALSSEHPRPPPAPSWRQPAPLRPPERIPGPKSGKHSHPGPGNGPGDQDCLLDKRLPAV